MNQQVKRYELDRDEDCEGRLHIIGMDEAPDGEWVRYEDHVASTKQNAPYGYYELGLRADRLQVELEAACAACTHLDERLQKEREYLAISEREVLELKRERDALQAKLQAVEALLKKPGCWSEWARECLAVLKGGDK